MQNETNTDKRPRLTGVMWGIDILLCALGTRLSSNSGFGMSMVAAPARVFFLFLEKIFPAVSYGAAEYIFQGLLLVLLAVVLRRFKWKYPVAFLPGLLFGLALDGWGLVFGTEIYVSLAVRIVAAVCGALISAFSIAGFLRSYLPQQVYELIVKEVTDKYGFQIGKVKWIYDISSLLLAVVMMLVLIGKYDLSIVGIGTLIATVINAPLISLFGKLLDKVVSFETACPKFKAWFDRYLD